MSESTLWIKRVCPICECEGPHPVVWADHPDPDGGTGDVRYLLECVECKSGWLTSPPM